MEVNLRNKFCEECDGTGYTSSEPILPEFWSISVGDKSNPLNENRTIHLCSVCNGEGFLMGFTEVKAEEEN